MNEPEASFEMKRQRSLKKDFFSRFLILNRRSSLPEERCLDTEKLTLRKRKPGSASASTTVRRQSCQTTRMEQNPQDNEYRVVLFGAGDVGKSALVWRFLRNTFKEAYTATIEDTYTHVINCGRNVCTLLITDTSGTHSFPAMRKLAIMRGNAFLLVYSIARRSSFENVIKIYDQMMVERGTLANIPLYLVGNKSDESSREVAVDEGEKLAHNWNCGFIETSAKTNRNVGELFKRLLALETARSLSLEKTHDKNLTKTDVSLAKHCVIA